MAAESINEIVSKEAIEQLLNLGKELKAVKEEFADLIETVFNLQKGLGNAQGYKETVSGINSVNTATENLHNKNVSRLEIERQIKKGADEMVATIMKEKELWEKVGQAMDKTQVDMQELTGRIVTNSIKLKENKTAQKEASDAISKAQKDYKNQIITIKEYNDIYDKNFEKLQLALETEQDIKTTMSEQQITLKNVVKEQNAVAGSMDEMNQRLGGLRNAYRGLSEEERNNADIGGVMKAGINQLDEALKGLDASIGNNQRNVGNYQIASKTLVGELRNMKNELLEAKININFFNDEISKQKNVLSDIAKTHGETSKEYKDAEAKLDKLISKQEEYVTVSDDLKVAIKDLKTEQKLNNAEMQLMTDPALAFKTLAESVNLATQSYTAYKGVLAFVGSENKELEQTMQKLMGLMMAANSIQKVTNSLLAQNGIISKAKILQERILVALNNQSAAAQARATAATAAQGTAAGIATGANIALAGAIRAVGTAIKSVPVIGWILAAVAALITLGTLIGKLVTAEKELTAEQKIRKQVTEDLNKIQSDVVKNTQVTVTKLNALTSELDKVKQGSTEWEAIVREIAKETGKEYDELVKFPDQIKEITDAWIEQYQERANMEATLKLAGENYAKNEEAIIKTQTASYKERKEAVKELSLSAEKQNEVLKYEHQLRSSNEQKRKEAQEKLNKLYAEARENVKNINNQLLTQSNITKTLTDQEKQRQEKEASDAEKKASDKAQADKDKRAEEAKKKEEERQKYLLNMRLKYAEMEADTDKKMLDLRIKRLEEQSIKEQNLYGKTEAEKAEIKARYQLEINKLEADYAKKQLDTAEKANAEMLASANKLNEERIRNSGISNEEMTRQLVEAVKSRHEKEYEQLELSYQKEVEFYKNVLAEGIELREEEQAAYEAIQKKWDAKLLEAEQKQADEIADIKRKGFDEQLKNLDRLAKNAENESIIAGNGAIASQTASQLKIDAINAEIEAWEEKKDIIEQLGITEQEYYDTMTQLQADKLVITKQMLDEEMQKRFELAQATTDAFFTISNAMTQNIEDEKERTIMQQKLAMAQVLLNQGIAIAQAINAATPGDPYTVAIRVASAIGAVIAGMVTSIASIRQAQSAYAEGTDYHRGGSAIIGERGAEVVQTPRGELFMVDKPSFFERLPIGTSVTPLPEFNSAEYSLNGGNWGSGEMLFELQRNNNLMEQLLRKPTAEINVTDKITSYINTKMSRAKVLNSYFKF